MAWVHPPAIGCRYSFLHLPCGRCGHTMNVYNSFIYIFGGYDGKRWLNDFYQFDTKSLVWSQPNLIGALPQARQYHASSIISSKLYIYGGYNGTSWLSDLQSLNLQDFRWQYEITQGSSPSGKEGLAMASIGNCLYVHGGWNGTANGDLHKFDTTSNEWSFIPTKGLRPELCGHSMTVVKDALFIFGGFDGKNWRNSLFIIRPEEECKWQAPQLHNPPGVRGYHSAVLYNKHVIIYAGYNGKYILADILALDVETLTWCLPEPCSGHPPSARNAHTMAVLGQQLYLFGGYNGTRDTNELHILEAHAFSTLHNDFRTVLECSYWKDVVLYSSAGSYSVHSIVIMARCKSLYAQILKVNPSFASRAGIVGVNMGKCCKEALKLFCEYLYCDLNKERMTGEALEDLFSLAIRLELPGLHGICRKCIYEGTESLPDSTLANDLAKIKDEVKFSDYNVLIQGVNFRLHRIVLYARCEYFRALFNSGMKESQLNSSEFNNIDPKAFELIVDWMYSDKFSPLFNDKAFTLALGRELLNATSFLHLDSLKRITEITIWKLIDCSNAFEMLDISCLFNTHQLKSYCVNYILRQFDRSTIRKDSLLLSPEGQEELLKYIPGHSKRKTNLSMPSDLHMVKYEKEREDSPVNSDPVMVSGQLFNSLKITSKIVIKSYSTLNSVDYGANSNNESIISNHPQKLKLKPRVPLKIRGCKAGGTLQLTERKDPEKFVRRKPRNYKSLTHVAKEKKELEKPDFFIKGFGSCRRGKSRMSSLVNNTRKSGLYVGGLNFSNLVEDEKPFVLPMIRL